MRTLIVAAVAAMGMTGIAIADEAKGPAVMTDAQMDLVVAGFTINGKTILTFEITAGDPLMIIVAGGQATVLPDVVFDNSNNGDTSHSFGVGPWSAAFGSSDTPASSTNGGPIDHAPVIINP